jgi:general secretion pathway protein A
VAVASFPDSTLPFEGLLECILEEFGIPAPDASHVRRLMIFKNFLRERHRAGLTTVLILDEAQNLLPATLEQVRLLSNCELPGAKLLQILLVGQPELAAKLALPELRQFRQRVALRFALGPLSYEESRIYIRSRLRIAGGRDWGTFSDRAIDTIVRRSGGIPRVINLLCDHCLVIGYADQKRRIDSGIVHEAWGQLHPEQSRRHVFTRVASFGSTLRRWARGTLAAAATKAGLGAPPVPADGGSLGDVARPTGELVER